MAKHEEFLVTADALFTAEGLVPGMALRVRDGIIAEISRNGSYARGERRFHFPGCTITPPLCDHHLHIPGGPVWEARNAIDELLACGITAAWDGGGRLISACELKNLAGAGFAVRASGPALFRTGTYGRHFGQGVESLKEAVGLIDRLAGEGVDYIKIINSGIFMPDTGDISPGGFSLSELTHMAECAKSRGLQVACHANGEGAIRDAVQAGADVIVHGLGVSPPVLDVMANRGVALIPTLIAFESLQKTYRSGRAYSSIARAVGQHCSAVKEAEARGVTLLAGSDSGPSFIPFGASLWEEVGLFRKSGLSPETVLSSASVGPLKKDAPADFLVLQGISLKEICLNGRWVKSREFRKKTGPP
ncbi:MAG: amidohydrolase family protein [Nitrospiraceae bacterium]|nr:MAG: amidohydrolase family protein [Nitrospiraceae bacterium]